MTDRRPLGLPVFTSPAATEDAEPPAAQHGPPVEQGAQFLPPPGPPADQPPRPGRRSLAAWGLTFSDPFQQT